MANYCVSNLSGILSNMLLELTALAVSAYLTGVGWSRFEMHRQRSELATQFCDESMAFCPETAAEGIQ